MAAAPIVLLGLGMHRIAIVPLLLAGCAAEDLGVTTEEIRGRNTSPERWPGLVLIENEVESVCTGVLIAPDVVLTAGHCDEAPTGVPTEVVVEYRWGGLGPRRILSDFYTIVDRCDDSDPICARLVQPHADLQLYRLDRPVPASERMPALLASNQDLATTTYHAVGYGGSHLQVATIDTTRASFMDTAICRTTYAPPGAPGELLCWDDVTEGGDSGGPLYADVGGSLAVVGILHGSKGRVTGIDHHDRPFTASIWTRIPSRACLGTDELPGTTDSPDCRLAAIPGVVRPSITPAAWRTSCQATPHVADADSLATYHGDFDGDGRMDVLYQTDSGHWVTSLRTTPDAFVSIEQTLAIRSAPIAVGHFTSEHDSIAVIDGDEMTVLDLDPASGWSELPGYQRIDLRALDPDWTGGGDYFLGRDGPRLAPIMRPGDLDRRDGLDDLLLVLSDKIVPLFDDGGHDWAIGPALPVDPYDPTVVVADVAAAEGDEVVVLGACGPDILDVSDDGWVTLYHSPCTSFDTIVSRPIVGDFDGDGCDDIAAKLPREMKIWTSSCTDTPGFTSLEGRGTVHDLGLYWRAPFRFDGWRDVTWNKIHAGDVDADGVDDLLGLGPHGLETRLSRWDTQEAFAVAAPFFQPPLDDDPHATWSLGLGQLDDDPGLEVVSIDGARGLCVSKLDL